MLQTKHNILKALFDIKPVDEAGRVDARKIAVVSPKLNLRLANKDLRNDKFFFGTWDESIGVKGFALIDAKKVNKKAPTDVASIKLVNSVGAAYSAVSPRLPSINSLTEPVLKSSEAVDNQKPHFVNEVYDSVDGTGFAPVGSWMAIPNRHYTPPTVTPPYQVNSKKQNPVLLLEKYLNSNLNIKKELKNIGGKTVLRKKVGKPRIKPIFMKLATSQGIPTCEVHNVQTSQDDYQTILSQINQRITPNYDELIIGEPRKIDPISLGMLPETKFIAVSPEIESWVRYASHELQVNPVLGFLSGQAKSFTRLFNSGNFLIMGVIGLIVVALVLLGRYGMGVKNEILTKSSSAVTSLEQAGENLRAFDFKTASGNFAEAYEEFSKAGESLNFMGVSITSLFAELPGFDLLDKLGAGKLESAKNLLEAGKLLAEAGQSMSEAVGSLSETAAALNVEDVSPQGLAVGNLKKSLLASSKNLSKVGILLADIDPSILPENKKEAFIEFQSKLPEFEKLISDAVGYTDFLEGFIGSNGTTKKYLVLFQNNSELRPTGGFPGTYAVVTFKDGRLLGFMVDDVYNLDGQLKENIIPPFPLQHITSTWGMRDANWFIDFSVSAQKVAEFFKEEAGYEVDGVLTMSPRMVSDVLKVVGPVEMPEYDTVVNDENFIVTIQEEIEYGKNRQQPKKIVMDMAPLLLERIYSANASQWLEIFSIFIAGLERKDLLMYFKDLGLESFVAEKGFGGLVRNAEGDFLMVTLSNIKGSKTDRVTDNFVKLATRLEEGKVVHKLELTRKHNGGLSKYGFYNKQNPAFMRVLVPKGAELISVSGNLDPNFKPLVNYSGSEFEKDDDLFKLESSFKFNEANKAWIYSESGRTGFAFWLITDPGEEKMIELEYAVPFDQLRTSPFDQLRTSPFEYAQGKPYNIYIQKQPGLRVNNFEFKMGNAYIYNGEFDKDLELKFKVK